MMFGMNIVIIGIILSFGITKARHLPENGSGGGSSRFRPRLLVIRPPPGSNQPNRLVILTNPRLLQSSQRRNVTSPSSSGRSRNSNSSPVSVSGTTRRPSQPRSLLSRGSPGRTGSLRNLVNMLRQNQRRQDIRPSSNIARGPSTIPRALPPVTPKASRFGDLNMPSVIEAALQRLREQAERHGAPRMRRPPAAPHVHSDVNIPRAKSPFSFLNAPGPVQTSVSRSSSSSSSSSSSKNSSSETVIQSSGVDSSGLLQSVSSSQSSSSNSKESFSSSSSHSHSHSSHSHAHPVHTHHAHTSHHAGMLHPNLMAARLNSASNAPTVVSNAQPGLTGVAGLTGAVSTSDDISPVLNSVQPAVVPVAINTGLAQTDALSAVPSNMVPNIARATSVFQPRNSGRHFQSANRESSSSSKSSSSSDTSSTVVSNNNVAVQSSVSSSKSTTQTKKTVTKKTMQETTIVSDETSAKSRPPVGSITVQRGPGGMQTITLSDGSGEPVVLRASGPVKIERIINAAGKVQFLINPIKPSALGAGEMEQEFEAEEILKTTTTAPPGAQRPRGGRRSRPNASRNKANIAVPTPTSFPIPWTTTTKRPPPPRAPPANNLAPPQMPVFESVLNQISELANSMSGGGFSPGAGTVLGTAGQEIVSRNIIETPVRTSVKSVGNSNSNFVGVDTIAQPDPSIVSSAFVANSLGSVVMPPMGQTLLNPTQGTIPISRTLVNSAIGDAGPVLDPQTALSNRVSVISNGLVPPVEPAQNNNVVGDIMHENQSARSKQSRQSNTNGISQHNAINNINTVFAGQGNAGPLPPYEITGQTQNSIPP